MLDAYRDLIDELLGTPSAIRGEVATEEEAGLSPAARRVIAELRDRDRMVLRRLQAITSLESPYLPALRTGEADPGDNASALLDEMEVARGDLVSLLMNLTLRDWERQAIDEKGGQVTLADEVERHVEFDEEHLQRFRELQRAP
jgi:hypothetical protein